MPSRDWNLQPLDRKSDTLLTAPRRHTFWCIMANSAFMLSDDNQECESSYTCHLTHERTVKDESSMQPTAMVLSTKLATERKCTKKRKTKQKTNCTMYVSTYNEMLTILQGGPIKTAHFYRATMRSIYARYCCQDSVRLSVHLSNACTVTKQKHLAKKVQL